MKITARFDYLYTGESNSRTLYLERDEKYAHKNICLGFVTPLGRLYITDPVSFTENSCEYLIPEGLTDGRGRLYVQLIATEGEEYVAKSKLYEYPVYASVDDLSLPEASAEDVKSIAVLFEMVKKKADEGHKHNDSYYTEEETDILLSRKSDISHLHGGIYLTRDEVAQLVADISADSHNHDERYMPKELVVTGVLDMANGTITGASASFSEISEAVEAGHSVKLDIDVSSATGEETYMSLSYLLKTDNAHIFDTVTDFGGPALVRGVCLANNNWQAALVPIASVTALKEYYSKNETDNLLGKKSDTGHSHSYLNLSDIPTIHNNIPIVGNITTNDLLYKGLLTSDDNLNEIVEDGVYVYSTSSLPKNAPFKNAAVVEVFGARSTTTQKIQRAYRYGDAGHSAFRPLYAGAWGEWTVAPTEYVTENGQSGSLYYKKWKSGAAEIWGKVTYTASSAVAAGGEYEFDIALPFACTNICAFIHASTKVFKVRKAYPLTVTGTKVTVYTKLESSEALSEGATVDYILNIRCNQA